MYDYLIVGAGLYAAVFAERAISSGKSVLVVEKRPHIGGNIFTEKTDGIVVHKYGAHIFHTNNREVWEYAGRFTGFNSFVHSPAAYYNGEIYPLPFNMYTFNKMWGVTTPEEALAILNRQRAEIKHEPRNLEEQAISLVGRDVFEKLIKGYTEKQWGRSCNELPSFIIRRIPVRLTYDNNYFNAKYQGIPTEGYTKMVENMLRGADILLNTDFLASRETLAANAKKVVYTGAIDAYFGYKLGRLEYRSLRFENERLDIPDFQGRAVMNYTDKSFPWTRIIEHKWFQPENKTPHTIISREFSCECSGSSEPCYPVNDRKNCELYEKYKLLAENESSVIFGGRLGEYKYYDMDKVIEAALDASARELGIENN